jgi:hypothetical protein
VRCVRPEVIVVQMAEDANPDNPKPIDLGAFIKWGESTGNCSIGPTERARYTSVTRDANRLFTESDVWAQCQVALRDASDLYRVATDYDLFYSQDGFNPKWMEKPVASAVEKCFRANVLHNEIWPAPPSEGWICPDNWFFRLNDNLRTSISVRYLDGVITVVDALTACLDSQGITPTVEMQARSHGYYGAHFGFTHTFSVPGPSWDMVEVEIPIEIQVRTDLQAAIVQMTHKYYESRRMKDNEESDEVWQWKYDSQEFIPNYLGHILHYLEGMIMEVRDRAKEKL